MASKPHYQGPYHRRSAILRQAAAANPATRCWRCGRTMQQIRQHKPHARWTAGHLVDGQPGGTLRPECSPCNYGTGAERGNRARAQTPQRTELTW